MHFFIFSVSSKKCLSSTILSNKIIIRHALIKKSQSDWFLSTDNFYKEENANIKRLSMNKYLSRHEWYSCCQV